MRNYPSASGRDPQPFAEQEPPTPVRITVHELLDYFGRCGACGYPASASRVVKHFGDGSIQHEVIATCGLPCGWRAPVSMRRMTGSP
ncbi:hypothetical protein [Nocardia caishijiensis]|uniref:Uncharacterized protein n=1 Tax=Nocardia caishijiensis TaxID=184756 RepID=A0ABQ6YLT9_9NOCA|nr:hypothetical protein [Nocardia caishijiensis]KAF0846633.1 hypothetical protein FNL39_10454 [Nocardia caishijiensis]